MSGQFTYKESHQPFLFYHYIFINYMALIITHIKSTRSTCLKPLPKVVVAPKEWRMEKERQSNQKDQQHTPWRLMENRDIVLGMGGCCCKHNLRNCSRLPTSAAHTYPWHTRLILPMGQIQSQWSKSSETISWILFLHHEVLL